jgi:protein-arginine kinase activator protein McsA
VGLLLYHHAVCVMCGTTFKQLNHLANSCENWYKEYVEYILSLVTVARFLPGQAKDLTAPPHIIREQFVC